MRIYFSTVVSVLGLSLGMAHAGPPDKPVMTAWSKPISEAQLDSQRGGKDAGTLTINANFVNAELNNNAAIDNVTGNNSISGNAFAGASGLPIVFQNTGNNVIMQNAMTLNLTVN